jgi:UDP-N-acetylmuramate dehydrogenase
VSVLGAQASLSAHTTLGLGGPANRLAEAGTQEQIVTAVREADAAGEPVLVLGGGSNLVVADAGFAGTVVRIASQGISISRNETVGGQPAVVMSVAAGEPWDRLVSRSVAEGLAGLECLSGIPGLAGATPIQNVGAYGQEVAQTITAVRAYDRDLRQVVSLSPAQCAFGYRTSMLKRVAAEAGAATGRYIVLAVSFGLRPAAGSGPGGLSEPVRYPQLAAALGVTAGDRVPLAAARQAVLDLRRSKGMVLDPADPDTRSAGSFFTNPVLTAAQFAELGPRVASRLGPGTEAPRYPAGPDAPGGAVKVSAAWLIEQAGFARGYPAGGVVRISTKHTLALTNPGGGSTAALLDLAREIAAGVRDAFGVDLVNEPTLVGVTL